MKKRKQLKSKEMLSLKLIFAIISSIVLIVSAYIAYSLYSSPIDSQFIKVKISSGATVSQSISIMNKSGALRPKWLFMLVAKYANSKHKATIKAGLHKLPQNMPNIDILKALFTGQYLYNKRITFPEGISYQRFASILSRKLQIDSAGFAQLCVSDSLLAARGIKAKSVEGYLHPATYLFDMDTPAAAALDVLLDANEKIWNEKFAAMAMPNNLDRHEVMTLASIVEAESPIADERPRIAGVYINRLNRKMPLQADPTVQYALGIKKRLLYSDLNADSPYNTYKYSGLPPGPINSPSTSSIKAVFNYERHNYLFFVAVGDGSGRHNFAKNFDEHRRFVAIFRNNARKMK